METISYKIKNKIKIGIVGSGDISEEYIKIINFFGHTVLKIVTKTKSKKNILFCKKHKIKHHYLDFDKSIKSGPKVDGWIICSSWDSLKENLLISIKHDIPILIEKSIIISSNDLLKIKSKLKKNQLRKISIGYNRNYYDFIPYLIKKIKKEGLNVISANLPEDYKALLRDIYCNYKIPMDIVLHKIKNEGTDSFNNLEELKKEIHILQLSVQRMKNKHLQKSYLKR